MSSSPGPQRPSSPATSLKPGGAEEVDHALSVMRQALAAHELPKAFSEDAWTELLKRESEFVGEVGLEAIRIARQKRSDSVSASDVGEADASIRRAGLGNLWTVAQTIGGVLAGGGVSGLIAEAGAKHAKTAPLAASIAGLVIGAAIIGFALGRTWQRGRGT
jgi:hypothetical protein